MTGWNVRGIVLDDSGLFTASNPDGFTSQWNDGGKALADPYYNFGLADGSFPDNSEYGREIILETPTAKFPDSLWFAVDAGTERADPVGDGVSGRGG